MFKSWLKNNYGYILLAISLLLNAYCFLYKPKDTKAEIERQTMQLKMDSVLTVANSATVQIQKQTKEIDSLSNLKRKPIYYKQKIKKHYEKDFTFYSNSNDSTKLYFWTKSVQKY